MSTTYEVIFLGTRSKIDILEGNEFAENAAGILGTYGTSTAPLSGQVRKISSNSLSLDDNTAYDTNNLLFGYDSFRIDDGAVQYFDAVATYNATITYADGTTATISAVVFQDTNGNTYLAPELTSNSDQAALTSKPIMSLTLNSVATISGDLGADRVAGDFVSLVDGTANADNMNVGYADTQGDRVSDGNDSIVAGAGNDTVNAGGGNDTVIAGTGNDSVFGGSGADSIDGGDGNDTIGGWSNDGGDDTMRGGAGNDAIIGGTGNDLLFGDDGDDNLSGGAGADTIFGGAGNDTAAITDDHNTDTYDLGEGTGDQDAVWFANWASTNGVSVTFTGNDAATYAYSGGMASGSFSGAEIVGGTEYNDTINASADTDGQTIFGQGGADTITVGSGANIIYGGTGADSISSGAGADMVDGGAGNDTLYFGTGGDTVYGGTGDDLIDDVAGWQAGAFNDYVDGGDGNDTIYTGSGNDTILGGAGNDRLEGEDGNDSIDGGAENDSLTGGNGNDTLRGGAGDDLLSSGDGAYVIELTIGGGSDRVADFNMTLVDGRTVDRLDVSELVNGLGDPVTWQDVAFSDTAGNGSGDAILTFPGGERVILEGISVQQAMGKASLYAMGIPCYVEGTPILTAEGWRPVESLVAGQRVITEKGQQLIIWAGQRMLSGEDLDTRPDWKPVHLPLGAIGNTQAMRLSPQHAVRMRDAEGRAVLVQARHLAESGFGGARVARGVRRVCYHHVLLERHEVMNAAGAATESFYPGRLALEMLDWASRLGVVAAIMARSGLIAGTEATAALAYGSRAHPLVGRQVQAGMTCPPFELPRPEALGDEHEPLASMGFL